MQKLIRELAPKEETIRLFSCPCCPARKKPFTSIRSLSVHLAKNHPEYPFKIFIKNGVAIRIKKRS